MMLRILSIAPFFQLLPPIKIRFLNLLVFLFSLLFTLVFSGTPATQASGTNDEKLINCDIQKTSCTQPLASGTVTLDILPRPVKAMADLTFHLSIKDIVIADTPFIDLGMPGMKMGPNKVQLKKTENGTEYSGTGIIVRCPSGRTIWKASVTLPGAGTVEYVFNVIY